LKWDREQRAESDIVYLGYQAHLSPPFKGRLPGGGMNTQAHSKTKGGHMDSPPIAADYIGGFTHGIL
jgi:hypothetical protein